MKRYGCLAIMAIVFASADALSQATGFPAGPAVDIRSFGAVPNDAIADTPALIAAMSGGGRTVVVPAGEYLIGTVSIPSNTVLQLASGATLRDTGQLAPTERLINVRNVVNVRISGAGARVISNRADYTTGEHRHGLFVIGSSNVEIIGLQSSSHGGDGFYLGTGARDVTIRDCVARSNRRQGLSVVSAVNLLVSNCSFEFTSGTPPSLGVDVEPNNNGDVLQNIRIEQVRTRGNAGGGISVGLSAYTGAAPPVRILILGHSSSDESPVYRQQAVRPVDRVTYLPAPSQPR